MSRWLFYGGIPYTNTKSLQLTGGDYVTLGNVIDYTSGTARSWTGYVYLSSLKVQAFVSKRDGTGNGFQFYTAANGAVYLYIQGSGGNLFFRTPLSVVGSGAWYHVAVCQSSTWTVAGSKIYVNAVDQTLTTITDAFSGSATNTADMRYAGHKNNSAYDLDGRLHRGVFWSKQLSAAEVSEDMGLKTTTGLLAHSAAANIISYHRFGNDPQDDATGGTGVMYDRVGGYNGTPVGTVSGDIITSAP